MSPRKLPTIFKNGRFLQFSPKIKKIREVHGRHETRMNTGAPKWVGIISCIFQFSARHFTSDNGPYVSFLGSEAARATHEI
jgi:hypothetical protein